MASKKIHLFRQSAVEAGTPGRYYLNPSEKLMSKAPDWSAVEHEDCIETRTNRAAFKDIPIAGKRYNSQAYGDSENKDDDYSYIMNTDFLDINRIKAEMKDGVSRNFIPKIKIEENNNSKKKSSKRKNQKKN
ncbi:hypothetical protein MKW94_006994 [Papaver nudicaule]|uniref:Uncharacterized protein n=1 Tax=Papaver nudicaule TaxID=74823 RepID=A0AA42ATQ9_PAPNU|nr:hypothetical protein [Papaver nudicaule]